MSQLFLAQKGCVFFVTLASFFFFSRLRRPSHDCMTFCTNKIRNVVCRLCTKNGKISLQVRKWYCDSQN